MLPGAHTRPRSLRTRSTIIRFSARSFSEPASARARARVLARDRRRAARVPLIGRLSTRRVGVDAQEALGRAARDRDLGQLEIGGERRGVAAAQRAVELPRIARERAVDAIGEARLIELARGDRLGDRLDRLAIGGDVELGVRARGRGRDAGARRARAAGCARRCASALRGALGARARGRGVVRDAEPERSARGRARGRSRSARRRTATRRRAARGRRRRAARARRAARRARSRTRRPPRRRTAARIAPRRGRQQRAQRRERGAALVRRSDREPLVHRAAALDLDVESAARRIR